MKNKTIAVIPARKNSLGIKNKNMVKLAGKPMIQYTLECAVASGVFDKIVVTSDDWGILNFARRFGADLIEESEKPHNHKEHCFPVVMEALEQVGAAANDLVFLLLPTSPLRQVEHVQEAFMMLDKTDPKHSVIGVTEICPFHSLRYDNNGTLEPLVDSDCDSLNKTRQKSRPLYAVNGSLFAAHYKTLKDFNTFHIPNSYSLVMEERYSIDINHKSDLVLAENLIKGDF